MLIKVFIFQLLFVLATIGFAQQTTEIKQFPPTKEPRQRRIDVKHIALNLQFDWQKNKPLGLLRLHFHR
ncbi:MAG: hypothetical protein HC846_07540 [Blastocatellia bacterium]|nr:hypothetical protein [Blastocatellia bacterium]